MFLCGPAAPAGELITLTHTAAACNTYFSSPPATRAVPPTVQGGANQPLPLLIHSFPTSVSAGPRAVGGKAPT